MSEINWLHKIPVSVGWYLSGFADGEGSFNVSLRKKDYGHGWQVSPSFNVSQRDRTNLALLKRWLGCGTLRMRRDGVVYFEVTSIQSLKEKVIPFFKKFHFLSSSKKTNFRIFKEILEKMGNGHFEEKELKNILRMREELNKGRGRKRKYNINDVFKSEKVILNDYTPNRSTQCVECSDDIV